MRMAPWACLSVLAFGCASHTQAPTDQRARSMAAISAAREAGATEVPAAALHYKLAEEQLAESKRVANDDARRAESLAMRAAEDAELARALARENEAKQRVQHFAQSTQGAGGAEPRTAPATHEPTQ